MAELKTPNKNAEQLITDHLDIWTTAIEQKSSSGRGSSKKFSLHGIKKLRELILELAVCGKLVPQDPNDEPASVLLERIAAERDILIKEKKLTKPKNMLAIRETEIPFELPIGWVCERFGNIYSLEYGDNLPKPKRSGTGEFEVYGSNGVVGTHDKKSVNAPCIIVGRKGSAGALNLCLFEGCWVTDVSYSTVPPADVSLRFAFLQFHTLGLDTLGKGIKPGLNRNEAYAVALALPPFKEQNRIVTKVDELMGLCDALEAQTENSITAHLTLVEVLLEALLKAPEQNATAEQATAQFQQNWQRLSEHFDTLFTTTASIDTLKQTILQLAVMGKLVPQNPNDEPITELMTRIRTHQSKRVKDKEIQKPKKVIIDGELAFKVPASWETPLLNDLVFVTKLAGFEYSKYFKLADKGEVPVIRAQNVRPFKPALNNLKYIDSDISSQLPRSALDRPSLLITFIGAGIGDVCVFDKEERWHLAPNVAKVEPYSNTSLHFLCIYLNSPAGKAELFKSMKSTAQPSLSMTTIREIRVALPPLEEQHRIVAKVDELIALCDQLQARLTDAQTTKFHLTDAIVEQAL